VIDIAVHDLNKYYGSNHVIKGITFEIYKGEKVGLLGKNGSGKSSIIKLITGEEFKYTGILNIGSQLKISYIPSVTII